MALSSRQVTIFALAFLQIAFIGWIDYLTSYEITLAIFYYIPIAYAAWQLGLRWSVAISLLCAMTLTWAEMASGRKYSSEWIVAERAAMRILVFGFVALSFSYFKTTRDRDRKRISQLEGLLTFCTCCHKLRDGAGNWIEFDEFIRQTPSLQTQAKVCPTCARTAYTDMKTR